MSWFDHACLIDRQPLQRRSPQAGAGDQAAGARGVGVSRVRGVGLILEPMASTLLAALRRVSPQTMVLLDPNCRPQAIRNMTLYREQLQLFLPRADVLKLSVDDVRTLAPDHELDEAAQRLLALGPAAVLVTDGPVPVNVLCAGGEQLVPVPEVTVVDMIGAGDAFVAGFLAWWRLQGLGREEAARLDLLKLATKQGIKVACAECTMKGGTSPRASTGQLGRALKMPPSGGWWNRVHDQRHESGGVAPAH
jgi:fructokinase